MFLVLVHLKFWLDKMLSFNNIGNLGRLANQMFQYAALKGIARNRGFDFVVPPQLEFGKRDINVRESLSLKETIYDIFPNLKDAPVGMSNNELNYEVNHDFDENLFNNCYDNIDLFGYYQSHKYFEHIEDEIRHDFTFSDSTIESVKKMMDEFSFDEKISLHIRRGDYLHNPNHPVQPIEYYKKALELLPKDIPVFVFSDDASWCYSQEFFNGDRFMISDSNGPAIDLHIMTLCDYHIIANSSFSWWGAWLAKSKKVIAPKDWFGADCAFKSVKDMEFGNWSWL